MKKFKTIILKILTLILFLYLSINKVKPDSIEDLNISLGLGYSIIENTDDNKYVRYQVPLSLISYKGSGENENIVRSGISESIGRTRDDRQRKLDKRFFLGMERIYIMDKTIASFGIEPILNILFKNPNLSDAGYLVICGGKSEDYLKKEVEGYVSPAEYIEGMIRNLPNSNFFGKNYTMSDVYLVVATEGKNLVAPYIEIKDKKFEITGMAAFNGFKLDRILSMEDTRMLNMLREKSSKGIISVTKEDREYVSSQVSVKKKVKCYKEGNKYNFKITLNAKGFILNNEIYKDISNNLKEQKDYENLMEEAIKKETLKFIDKMQKEYKVDYLNLGDVAAGKYGRNLGIDWNEAVSNSKIEVQVKFKLDRVGRGQ